MNFVIVGLVLCCVVNVVNGRTKTRIANRGEKASEGEFPYQVSIQLGHRHICGGSLISKNHVLTAAHCVQEGVDARRFPGPLTVEVGSTEIGGGQTHKIKRVSYYHGYGKNRRGTLYPNDIAMIHLASPVTTSDKVKIINLPSPKSMPPPGSQVILSGFGNSKVNTSTSSILKKMDATIGDHKECYRYYLLKVHVHLTFDKICAAKQEGYGACQGDSGGPLVDNTKSTVLGVVSAGDGQCSNGQPDTYTDVTQFISYINDELNYNPNNPIGNRNPAINFGGSNPSPYPGYPQTSHNFDRNPLLNPHIQQGRFPGSSIHNPFRNPHQPMISGQRFFGVHHQAW